LGRRGQVSRIQDVATLDDSAHPLSSSATLSEAKGVSHPCIVILSVGSRSFTERAAVEGPCSPCIVILSGASRRDAQSKDLLFARRGVRHRWLRHPPEPQSSITSPDIPTISLAKPRAILQTGDVVPGWRDCLACHNHVDLRRPGVPGPGCASGLRPLPVALSPLPRTRHLGRGAPRPNRHGPCPELAPPQLRPSHLSCVISTGASQPYREEQWRDPCIGRCFSWLSFP